MGAACVHGSAGSALTIADDDETAGAALTIADDDAGAEAAAVFSSRAAISHRTFTRDAFLKL